MAVDRVDLAGQNPRVGQSPLDTPLHPRRVRRGDGASHPVAAAVHHPAQHLGIDPRPPLPGRFQLLQEKKRPACAGDKTGGACAHRPGGLFRSVVELPADHPHRIKTGPDVRRGPFRAARKHPGSQSEADARHRLDDRLVSGAARRGVRGYLVSQGQQPRDPRAGPAVHHLFNDSAPHPPDLSLVHHRDHRPGDRVHSTDSRSGDYPRFPVHVVVFGIGHGKAGIGPGVYGRHGGVADIVVDRQQLFMIEIALPYLLESLRNTPDLTGEVQLLQFRNMADARTPCPKGLCESIQSVAVRRHHPHPCNNHPAFHNSPF